MNEFTLIFPLTKLLPHSFGRRMKRWKRCIQQMKTLSGHANIVANQIPSGLI